jgi:hypothetical protein
MLAKTESTEPRVVNGINVDDLLALIEGVRRDAAEGNTSGVSRRRGRANREFVARDSLVLKFLAIRRGRRVLASSGHRPSQSSKRITCGDYQAPPRAVLMK